MHHCILLPLASRQSFLSLLQVFYANAFNYFSELLPPVGYNPEEAADTHSVEKRRKFYYTTHLLVSKD
jgi:hypothetical protein